MPRSLLLSLVAAFTLAACSKQEAETGAAPADSAAPEANAPVDTTAVDRMPADTAMAADTAMVEEPAAPPAETDGQHDGRADRHGRAGRQLCRLLSSVDKHTVER